MKGNLCIRRFIAGGWRILWLPTMTGLELRRCIQKSWRMKRAEILSPPVMGLDPDSFQASTLSGFDGRHKRAPRSPAKSVGWRSPRVSTKVSIEAVAA